MNRTFKGIIAFLLFSSTLFAGTTGKIAGKVVDANSGEPIIGANIMIDGTFLGASTDIDGDYYIINVPIGEYTMTVSYIGYSTLKHSGVKVVMDQTAKVNFNLSEEIATGEVIEVVAETFKVQKDETSKKMTISQDDIQALPVKDFSELVAAQAGVVQIQSSVQGISGFEDRGIEEIHVRGGRSGEIGYTIDGMYILNPFYGSKYSWTQLNEFATEQVDMKYGVFDAEYGGAMSSMINIVTSDGGDKLEGNLRINTSNPANLTSFFDNEIDPQSRADITLQQQDYLRDYREISGGLGGPIPLLGNKVKFIITGHKLSTSYRTYEFDDITYNKENTNDPENMYINPLDTISGWHNMGFRHSWDIYGKMSFQVTNTMKLDVSAWNLETTFRTANLANSAYQYFEKGRNIDTQTSDRQSIIFNHQLSNKTFYDIRASRFFQKMFIGVTDDGTINGRYLDPDEYEGPSNSEDYDTNPFWWEFYVDGHDRYYHTNFAETYEGIFNVLSQVTKHHQLKAGATYRQHTIMIDETQLPWLDTPYIEKYTRHPEEAAVYIQDLIEYDYMTIHVGMRVDLLNARDTYWEDPYADYGDKVEKKSEWEVNYSPRISFSHVITDNSTFTFGYGQFTQTPTYRNKYLNPDKDVRTFSPLVGNAALSLEKMTAYEFGLNVGMGKGLIMQLIGWSKEYSGLTSTERIQQFPYSYTIALNTDYATSRGFDFVVRRMTPTYSFILEYTYSRATANRKDPWEGYRETDTPRTMPKREILMSYDRTHDIGLTLIKRYAPETGPRVFGYYPLEKTNLSVMFLAMSGAPYTPIVGDVLGETNSERGPWNITANLNFRKYFNLFGNHLILGIRVQNLFDWLNPIDIYARTGTADDPGARANELIEDGITSKTFWNEPYRYGRRRQVDFSLEYAF